MRTESEEREVEAGGAAALEAGGAVLPQPEEARKPDPCTEVLIENNVNWPRRIYQVDSLTVDQCHENHFSRW